VLLGKHVLAFARTWRYREKIELEAADQFRRLATELAATGALPLLVDMASEAAQEEEEHAVLCRKIVDSLQPGLRALEPNLGVALGPEWLPRSQRALYASVALSCVTESLSTAFLLEMRELVTNELIRKIVQRILKDEIKHSRLGWAHLAAEAEQGDVSWLGEYVPMMLRDAVASDVVPLIVDSEAYGILSSAKVHTITRATTEQVIFPGLQRFGIDTSVAERERGCLPPRPQTDGNAPAYA